MPHQYKLFLLFLLPFILITTSHIKAQTNLLLNGGFEDVNTCTEYNAECGVEGWFYLKDVKAQMLSNDSSSARFGNNSFGIFFTWREYTGFSPVIGTLLPCRLQKGKQYTFKGLISARLNPRLILKAGLCLGERFYVPKRPFAKTMQPDSIISMLPVAKSNFYEFEYRFTAQGTEKYFTFGTYIAQDSTDGKKPLTGTQTVSLVLDNFQLIPADPEETLCPAFTFTKERIYNYNFRHKEMDYSLYGKGELAIAFDQPDTAFNTQILKPPPPPVADTVKLGDVLFDFNKANLKPAASAMLATVFLSQQNSNPIDSMYIEGHTDSVGTDKRNMTLSQERCESVKKWLLLNSVVDITQVQVHPFGKTRPIATNSTAEGRALNRRVELIVFRRRR